MASPRVVPDPNAGTSVVQSKRHDALVAWRFNYNLASIIILHRAATLFDLSNDTPEHACNYDFDHLELPTADGIGLCLQSMLMLTY